MDIVPDEILIIIFTYIFNEDDARKWQRNKIKLRTNFCLVCSKFDRIIIHDIILPFHRVLNYYDEENQTTYLITRFRKIECVNIVGSVKEKSPDAIPIGNDTKYVIKNRYSFNPDIVKRNIKVIENQTYQELIDDFRLNPDVFLPDNIQELLTLNVINDHGGWWNLSHIITDKLHEYEAQGKRIDWESDRITEECVWLSDDQYRSQIGEIVERVSKQSIRW